MKPEESKIFTASLEKAAIALLRLEVFRKPDDLARRFGLPLPVPRHWWRNTDQKTTPIDTISPTPKQAKMIRRATQILEGWEKRKRYRPDCGASLNNGKRCKNSVAIRPPEGWDRGCLADRCRIHGGLARTIRRKKTTDVDE
jgi:hypothetical protein